MTQRNKTGGFATVCGRCGNATVSCDCKKELPESLKKAITKNIDFADFGTMRNHYNVLEPILSLWLQNKIKELDERIDHVKAVFPKDDLIKIQELDFCKEILRR